MKTIHLIFPALLCFFPPDVQSGGNTDLEDAMNATAAFALALKSELMESMQAGGALSAVDSCKQQAPAISSAVSDAKNMNVSRVSLKNRNPGNAPNEWQTAVLEQFEARKLAGEDVMTLTWHEVSVSAGTEEFRFMKAIPTAALCLQCHGEEMAPSLSGKLAGIYPEDKATGYREGDIRGAFVVTRELD